MAFQAMDWKVIQKTRSDLTGMLTHLTRRQDDKNLNAIDVLIKILNEKNLAGSTKGFIIGSQEVVCFQEAPLYSRNIGA
ncbi:hypothetical protein [Bacillus infantis]|uniref:Uncharacterized protein n=1 Tax=Bacillus infantis TaxID=324767 RepID=A0A5D4RB57_9BACI|nr:hypothetical protein [Bacillus infantis]TYS46792.1 hypothetical protein FZD51_15080 [Bacillus infantis]